MKIHIKGKKRHDSIFRDKFGIGLYQYETLLNQQNGVCFLCNNSDFRNLAVDHNHKTGKVRRLLCTSCNVGLGKFNDDPTLLRKAADYIESDFDLPGDKVVNAIHQKDRPRWRNIIIAPDGIFTSAEAASRYYNCHATSISRWAGAYSSKFQKDGWQVEKKYSTITEIKEKYNVIS